MLCPSQPDRNLSKSKQAQYASVAELNYGSTWSLYLLSDSESGEGCNTPTTPLDPCGGDGSTAGLED